MQRLPKQIAAAQLGVVSADLCTTPANTKRTISACSVTNKTDAARIITLAIRKPDNSAFILASSMNLGAHETRIVHGALAQTLEAGDVLAGNTDAADAIDIVVSAYETNP